jgi:HEPN domain-containing protein
MPADERVLSVVRGWVQKAESDLKTALLVLRAGDQGPADTVAFHAQQCAEKYLKALLASEGIDFPKTHDIGQLVLLLPQRLAMNVTVEEQRRLTSYATVTRYPGDYEPVTIQEARCAVAIARRIRARTRKLLPAPVWRRKHL